MQFKYIMYIMFFVMLVAFFGYAVYLAVFFRRKGPLGASVADEKHPEGYYLSMGISMGMPLGVAVGVSLGAAMDNIPLGVSLGPAFGAAFGVTIGAILEGRRAETIRPLNADEKRQRKLAVIIGGGLVLFGIVVLLWRLLSL